MKMKRTPPQDILDIRELYASGNYSQTELSEIYGVAPSTVFKIVNGFSHQKITGGKPVKLAGSEKKKNRCVRGEEHWEHKLTDKDVMEIRRIWANRVTQTALAEKYGVSIMTIHSAISGKSWRHLPSVEQIQEEMRGEP